MRWAKVIGPTALSSTTDVLLGGANLKAPALAKSILAVIPQIGSPAGPTTAEPIAAKLTLQSNDFFVQPYITLPQPIGASLAKSGIQPQWEAPIYPVNCPIKGGSELMVYGTGLYNHTIEPYMAVTVIFADYVAGPQVHAKIGTFTNTGASAAEVKGSGIRLTGGKKIIEVNGFVVGTTVATLKGICSKMRLASSGLQGMGDLEWALEHVSGTIATDATTASVQECAKLSRVRDLDVPITDPIDLDDYHNLIVALTTTGNWVIGILFI